jgi:hypothetical protein
MLAKQNTGGNAAKFFQGANEVFRNSQDMPGPPRTPKEPPDGGKLVLENT